MVSDQRAVTAPPGTPDTSPTDAHDHSPRWRQLLPYAVVLLGWLAALPLTGHYANPDGPSYAVVARRWAAGDVPDAINAYWGPLLSWLSAPLQAAGVAPLLALRLVLLAGALLTIAPLRSLCRRAGAGAAATDIVLVAGAAVLVYAASFGLYADVLMNMALLRMLDLLLRPAFLSRSEVAVRAGLWAAVAYLARAYAVPVVLLVLPLGAALHVLLAPPGRRPLAAAGRGLALAAAAAAVVGGAWAATLSLTYDRATFSTSAGFNTELVAPGSAGNPFNVRGLYEPVRADGFSAWEEPSELAVPVRESAPGGELGQRDAAARLELAVANARIAVGSVLRRGAPFAALALVAVGAVALRRRPTEPVLVGTLAAGAIAAGGLLLVIAIERYLWFPVLASLPAAAVGLDLLVAGRRRFLPLVAAGVVGLSTVGAVHGLLPRVGAHDEVTAASRAFDAGQLEDHRTAAADSWQRSHHLCFRVGCEYLGRPLGEEADEVAAELHAAEVDHLLVWDEDLDAIAGLPRVGGSGHLTVFAVTDLGLEPAWRVEGTTAVPLGDEPGSGGGDE